MPIVISRQQNSCLLCRSLFETSVRMPNGQVLGMRVTLPPNFPQASSPAFALLVRRKVSRSLLKQ